ncbi:OmpH family outer membrane protein [Sphingorhabdus sp.]|jgi:Skp family chaperone for outer membrane proteins|uniref:OmpH family outer membrane protein n=1 Tax=Sphingorhabdus sp. TaxID=1902408 RepID=UPI0037C5952B
MKIRNTAIVAALLSATAIAVPATAQVSGIATAETSVAIARTKALGTAYQQIGTQYAGVVQQMQTKRQEINNINVQLDTNKDKELTQAELDAAIKAKNPLLTQLDEKQKEINTLQEPIILAQLYAVEQIAVKYEAAQQAVVAAKKISVILAPDAFVWAPEAVDVTSAITAELDKAIPTASITPPAGYRPSRQIGALYQQIQQLFNNAAQMQAAQAAAAQPRAAAPASPAAQPESR